MALSVDRFSIDRYRAIIDRNNAYAKPNRFFVSFTAPLGLPGTNPRENVEFYCEAVNLPGFQLHTGDGKRYTYGPSEKRPFAPQVSPLQLQVVADGSGLMWKFFHNWMTFIMPHDMRSGMYNQALPEVVGANPAFPYEVEYKDNYVTQISIFHLPETYSETENPDVITQTICIGAFPSAISDMQLSWSDNNNICRFAVQLDYLEWFSSTAPY